MIRPPTKDGTEGLQRAGELGATAARRRHPGTPCRPERSGAARRGAYTKHARPTDRCQISTTATTSSCPQSASATPEGVETWLLHEAMETSTDEFFDYLRRSHRGSGDEWGHWSCTCGASGGGTGPNARDWTRGHNMHLRNVSRRKSLKEPSSNKGQEGASCQEEIQGSSTPEA